MKEVAVVIPIYKSNIEYLEKISLIQARKIFSNYDIYFLMPESLSISFEHSFIRKIRMPDEYFISVAAYNRLMLTCDTYRKFIDYKYILIYQLDAFVFEDRLHYFCNLNYDYIGAPWLYGVFEYISQNKSIWYVGNGGVSLRNVQSTISLLQEKKCNYMGNEDIFFASSESNNFQIAPLDIALQFSFDEEVDKAFAYNNYRMPMCAHAWEKYNINFYKPYIEAEGFLIPNCIDGELDKQNINDRKHDRDISEFFNNKYTLEILEGTLYKKFSKYKGKLVIWGCGRNGTMLRRMIEEAKQNIVAVIDKNGNMNYSKFKAKYTDKEIPIIVSPNNAYDEIVNQLEEDGYCNYIGFRELIDDMIYNN